MKSLETTREQIEKELTNDKKSKTEYLEQIAEYEQLEKKRRLSEDEKRKVNSIAKINVRVQALEESIRNRNSKISSLDV